jgi:hypothetical protein
MRKQHDLQHRSCIAAKAESQEIRRLAPTNWMVWIQQIVRDLGRLDKGAVGSGKSTEMRRLIL